MQSTKSSWYLIGRSVEALVVSLRALQVPRCRSGEVSRYITSQRLEAAPLSQIGMRLASLPPSGWMASSGGQASMFLQKAYTPTTCEMKAPWTDEGCGS